MILPSAKDAKHKAWLFRLLSAICDDSFLAENLYFKGGTSAAMRNLLDRFSVDLDFDFVGKKDELPKARKKLEKMFKELGLEIKDSSKNTVQYFLKYPASSGERNTLKIDATFPPPKANEYEPVRLIEIGRIAYCQTIETMFANKLVALIERFEKNKSIAGRDLYDVHYFFLNGFGYGEKIILERRKKKPKIFFKELVKFIKNHINQTIIDQDLNTLLPPKKFSQMRKTIQQETIVFLEDEIKRIP
jgi:hypothetical protein